MLKKIRPYFDMGSALKDVPPDWLRLVEPKIRRYQQGRDHKQFDCWLWEGPLDKDGEPIFHMQTDRGTRTMRRVKRVVAAMFWTISRHNDVLHHCGVANCLNPAHLRVSIAHWKQEVRRTAT